MIKTILPETCTSIWCLINICLKNVEDTAEDGENTQRDFYTIRKELNENDADYYP